MKRRWVVAAGAAAAYWVALHLGSTWGSTRQERLRSLPSDDLVPDAYLVTNHAITMRARGDDVWPWLVQMGWHRGGWYTYRWVDRLLFPANAPSADRILPEFQGLQPGDRIPDGPPEANCFFVVERMEPGRTLVLRSTSHLPPWPSGRWLDWVWTYTLERPDADHVRVLLRARTALGPPWLARSYRAMLWMDFVMARSHLRGLRRRVEAEARSAADVRSRAPVRSRPPRSSRRATPDRTP
jgi:hypothetical protein